MQKIILTLLLTVLMTSWLIELRAHTSGTGEKFVTTYNSSGAVLKSSKSTIYLSKNCAASSANFGKGKWNWANGGFEIIFPTKSLSFPRQEIAIEDDSKCNSANESPTLADKPQVNQKTKPVAAKNSNLSPTIQQIFNLCAKDQYDMEMQDWGNNPANRNALAIERVYAIRAATASAKKLCTCVIEPLKSGKQTVANDFMSKVEYTAKMKFACSLYGEDGLLKQLSN